MHKVCIGYKYKLQLVKLLTALPQCDINAESNDGVRPIHLAADEGDIEIVYHLVVDCGCDVAAKDKSGRNPVDYSTRDDITEFLIHAIDGTPFIPENKCESYLYIN